ncbi:MAG: YraN family protein [Clostridia bacterium]|nr:YraN family protein [Clostridia bacterium]
MPPENKRLFGKKGEDIAVKHLKENNYVIVQRNFREGRIGEIDIIAREREFICFVEVKARTSIEFGMPSEAVNYRKQSKIKKLAYIYVSKHKLYDSNLRFDIVEIVFSKDKEYTINLIKNAF